MTTMGIPTTNEEAWALASSWSTEREMTPFEALMWRMEVDARLRSPMTMVDLLDAVPDWERLRAAHDWGSRLIPRFRQRVQEPLLGLGSPAWIDDPDFDLDYHLQRVALPEPGTRRQLLDFAQAEAMTPFDRARPPWRAVLCEGLEGDRAAYLLKIHHSMTDGQGGVQLIGLLHSRQREPSPAKSAPPPRPGEDTGPVRVLAEQALQAPAAAVRGVREVQLIDLKSAGKAAGGSLNDAYVAAVLGGFRLYHEELGSPIDSIPMAMPISLRSGDHPMGGNRFAGARFAAPVGAPDPVERIRLVHEFVLHARDEPAIDALGFAAPVLYRVPPPLFARWYAGQTAKLDLQASNVAGLPWDAYIAGAKIERMLPFGPVPGCAVMATLLSYAGTCSIGISCDAAAVTDPGLFMECLQRGLDEVLALAS
jgi:diacylglycerol O-acyltransferase / wax synthase